jgi:hypothetical protein
MAFGILCNKWMISDHAIDVYPESCDVIVQTCCMLHNFVRQRDGFRFQDTLYKCPLDSIKAVGTGVNVTGTDIGQRGEGQSITLRGVPLGACQGPRLPGTDVWKKSLEKGTSIHTGPVRTHGGGGWDPVPRELRYS